MIPSDFDRVLLRHIADEMAYLAGSAATVTREKFLADDTLKRAWARSLEIIGEGVKQLSAELIARHPDIEWRKMAGFRDKLIHGYFPVDYPIIWNAVNAKIPGYALKISEILGAGRDSPP